MPIHVWLFMAVGCLMVLAAVTVLWMTRGARALALRFQVSNTPQFAGHRQDKLALYRTEKWIPLTEASKIMYDELDGTRWRTMADKEATPEERLNYMAAFLVHSAPVEGRTPPCSSHKNIPSDDFDSGIFKGGGRYFQRDYESYFTFIDMRIRVADLRDTLNRMKAVEKGTHATEGTHAIEGTNALVW